MENSLQVISNSEPQSENQIIKSALAGTLIKSALAYEIDGAVSASVDKAIFYLGLKTLDADRDSIKIAVIDDVKRHFPLLTVSEIGIAIENGSKGKFGKVVGLAPKDIYDWLTAYSTSEERRNQVVELAKKNDEPRKPTEEEMAKTRWSILVNAWATYKQKGSFNDIGNCVYNILMDNEKINYSDEQMADFLRMAKAEVMKQYNPLLHVGNFVKVNEYKAILEEVQLQGDKNARVISESKKLTLNHFFKELAEMDMDIQDLFAE